MLKQDFKINLKNLPLLDLESVFLETAFARLRGSLGSGFFRLLFASFPTNSVKASSVSGIPWARITRS